MSISPESLERAKNIVRNGGSDIFPDPGEAVDRIAKALQQSSEREETLIELLTECVELIFNSAEQARKEGVPSCNLYDMERLISKTDIPSSKFRYVGAWKAYESIMKAKALLSGEGKK